MQMADKIILLFEDLLRQVRQVIERVPRGGQMMRMRNI